MNTSSALRALSLALIFPAAALAEEHEDSEMIEAGRAVYNDTCAGYCHGRDGTAGGQAGTFHGQGLNKDDIRDTIREGIPGTAMPPWEGTLSDQEIEQVTVYLASLQEAEGVVRTEVSDELPEDELTVCLPPDRPPYSMDEESGRERPGLEAEIAEAVLEGAGLEYRIAYTNASHDPGLYACDIYMGQARPAEPQRLGDRFYTRAYYGSGYLLAMPEETGGTGVAVEAASLAERFVEERNLPPALYSSQSAVLQALVEGEVEGGLVRLPELAWHLNEESEPGIQADLAAEPDRDARWNAAIQVHRPAGALEAALNEAISELLENGGIEDVFEDYGLPYHTPFRQTRRD